MTRNYPIPTVNFDKNCWSVQDAPTFRRLTEIFLTLFKLSVNEDIDKTNTPHEKSDYFESEEGPLIVYYYPRNSLNTPLVRLYPPNNRDLINPLYSELQTLPNANHYKFENSQTSLSVHLEQKKTEASSDSRVPLDRRVKKILQKSEIKKQTGELVKHIRELLSSKGFRLLKRSELKTSNYEQFSVYSCEFFRININYNPPLESMPYAFITISHFNKQQPEHTYRALMFFLSLIQSYSHCSQKMAKGTELRPSLVELSLDFNSPDFILELTRSVTCSKNRDNYGWTASKNSPLKKYDDVEKGSLLTATHYLGRGKDTDYQIVFYNRDNDITRLEFRLKSRMLRKLNINSVSELFTSEWGLSFIGSNRIKFLVPNQKAYEKVDSKFHHLAETSLKAFISKAPKAGLSNFMRDCLDENKELRTTVETAIRDFHKYISAIFKNTEICVVIPENSLIVEDYTELFFDEKTNSLIAVETLIEADLIKLFSNLYHNHKTEIKIIHDCIAFSIKDESGNITAVIVIGEINKNIPHLKKKYPIKIAKLSDYFGSSNSVV